MMQRSKRSFAIRKPYDPVQVRPQILGFDEERHYRLHRDLNGNASYVVDNEYSISEYVGSFEDMCSLKSILQRIEMLPLQDKVNYLNQNPGGVYADLTAMPKDLTSAMVMINDFQATHPEVFKRVVAGENFETVVKDVYSRENKIKRAKEEKKKQEVNANGKNESGNE